MSQGSTSSADEAEAAGFARVKNTSLAGDRDCHRQLRHLVHLSGRRMRLIPTHSEISTTPRETN